MLLSEKVNLIAIIGESLSQGVQKLWPHSDVSPGGASYYEDKRAEYPERYNICTFSDTTTFSETTLFS